MDPIALHFVLLEFLFEKLILNVHQLAEDLMEATVLPSAFVPGGVSLLPDL